VGTAPSGAEQGSASYCAALRAPEAFVLPSHQENFGAGLEGRRMSVEIDTPVEEHSRPVVRLSAYRDRRPGTYLLKRFLWSCVQVPFWPKMPRRLSPLRVALLRMFGARVGRGCLIEGARIWVPWNFCMGEFSVVANGAEIYNLAPVQIGANSVVSQRAYLCTASHDYAKAEFPIRSKPITIGSSVWVAACAFIAPGVNVGEGAVVGACSVVTKDVPPWSVCAGNPCRVIRPRKLDQRDSLPLGAGIRRGGETPDSVVS